MPATETQTPEQWAEQVIGQIQRGNEFTLWPDVQALAALKARADQADRMAAVLRDALPYLQHLAATAPVGSDAERVADMIEAALADNPKETP